MFQMGGIRHLSLPPSRGHNPAIVGFFSAAIVHMSIKINQPLTSRCYQTPGKISRKGNKVKTLEVKYLTV